MTGTLRCLGSSLSSHSVSSEPNAQGKRALSPIAVYLVIGSMVYHTISVCSDTETHTSVTCRSCSSIVLSLKRGVYDCPWWWWSVLVAFFLDWRNSWLSFQALTFHSLIMILLYSNNAIVHQSPISLAIASSTYMSIAIANEVKALFKLDGVKRRVWVLQSTYRTHLFWHVLHPSLTQPHSKTDLITYLIAKHH